MIMLVYTLIYVQPNFYCHTHAHISIYMNVHIGTHAYAHILMRPCMHVCLVQLDTCIDTHLHTHIHVRYIYTQMYSHTHEQRLPSHRITNICLMHAQIHDTLVEVPLLLRPLACRFLFKCC